jgi:hypothetical protein
MKDQVNILYVMILIALGDSFHRLDTGVGHPGYFIYTLILVACAFGATQIPRRD